MPLVSLRIWNKATAQCRNRVAISRFQAPSDLRRPRKLYTMQILRVNQEDCCALGQSALLGFRLDSFWSVSGLPQHVFDFVDAPHRLAPVLFAVVIIVKI